MNKPNGFPILLILIIGISAGFMLVAALGISTSAFFTPFNNASLDTSRGKSLFRQNCASCHAVQKGIVGRYGPNLHDIGQIASKRVEGMHAQDYILQSILYPEAYKTEGSGHMPQGTVDGVPVEIVRSLVGYLASLGGVVDKSHLQQLVIEPVQLESAVRKTSLAQLQHGWDLFYNDLGCVACHAVNGLPGTSLRAPSLAKAGLLSEEYLLSSIRYPSASVANVWRLATVTIMDGRSLVGRIISKGDSSLSLLHSTGTKGSLLVREDFDLSSIQNVEYAGTSSMPDYTLTIKDEQALVGFLKSLVAEP